MRDESTVPILIKQIHSEMEKTANNSLRQDDLTLAQITVLLELDQRENGEMELKELEHSLHVAQSTAAGIAKRLEQKGFVQGYVSAEDRRRKLIRITPTGLSCCRNAEENMRRTEHALTAALTEAEQVTLLTLLQKVRNSFQ